LKIQIEIFQVTEIQMPKNVGSRDGRPEILVTRAENDFGSGTKP